MLRIRRKWVLQANTRESAWYSTSSNPPNSFSKPILASCFSFPVPWDEFREPAFSPITFHKPEYEKSGYAVESDPRLHPTHPWLWGAFCTAFARNAYGVLAERVLPYSRTSIPRRPHAALGVCSANACRPPRGCAALPIPGLTSRASLFTFFPVECLPQSQQL